MCPNGNDCNDRLYHDAPHTVIHKFSFYGVQRLFLIVDERSSLDTFVVDKLDAQECCTLDHATKYEFDSPLTKTFLYNTQCEYNTLIEITVLRFFTYND